MRSRGILAPVSAIASLLVAASCCLPLAPVLGAFGLAGASVWLGPLRPYLMGSSVVLLAAGFIQAYSAKRCGVKRSFLSLVLLWVAAAFTVLLLGFPQVVAGWVAGR